MNTCLQCLLSINELTTYFKNQEYKKDRNLKFCNAYYDCVNAGTPESIKKLSKKKFDPKLMHDSQEFLIFILSGMEEELNKKNKRKIKEWNHPDQAWDYFSSFQTSIINKLFTGMFVSRVKCTNCKNISESYDTFLDISLSIKDSSSIDECFEEFFSLEKLSDEYKCENFNK